MQLAALKEQLLECITNADLDGFFVLFKQWVRGDAPVMREMSLQQASWNSLKKRKSTLSVDEYNLEFRRITSALIDLTNELNPADLNAPPSTPPPPYQFDYELNRADRTRELWELNTFCDEDPDVLQRFVLLVADRDAEAEAFADRWLLEQANLGRRRYIYEQEEKENGRARGIQVLRWEYGLVALQERIRQGLQQARNQGGDARFVAFIRISGDFLRNPGPRLLADLTAITETCTGEHNETCAAFIFLHLEEAPGDSGTPWQQQWETCLACMKVLSQWSAVTRNDIGSWLAGKGLSPWQEDDYLNRWILPGQESISMRYFRGYAREFLSARDRY